MGGVVEDCRSLFQNRQVSDVLGILADEQDALVRYGRCPLVALYELGFSEMHHRSYVIPSSP